MKTMCLEHTPLTTQATWHYLFFLLKKYKKTTCDLLINSQMLFKYQLSYRAHVLPKGKTKMSRVFSATRKYTHHYTTATLYRGRDLNPRPQDQKSCALKTAELPRQWSTLGFEPRTFRFVDEYSSIEPCGLDLTIGIEPMTYCAANSCSTIELRQEIPHPGI